MRSLTTTWWGADPNCLLNIYKSIIRSTFDYSGFLMSPISKQLFCKLEKIQFKCLRIALGQMQSCPTNSLLVEASEPPLHLRFKFLASKFILSKVPNSKNDLIANLSKFYNFSINSRFWLNKDLPTFVNSFKFLKPFLPAASSILPIYIFDFEINFVKLVINFDCPVSKKDTLLPNSIKNCMFNNFLKELYPEHIYIYTDASKDPSSDNAVGTAVYCENNLFNFKIKSKLNKNVSIFEK